MSKKSKVAELVDELFDCVVESTYDLSDKKTIKVYNNLADKLTREATSLEFPIDDDE